MKSVSISDARTRLAELVDEAAAGKDVVIRRKGKPPVRITRLEVPKRHIVFGLLKGKLTVPDNFDAVLPDKVIASFEGR